MRMAAAAVEFIMSRANKLVQSDGYHPFLVYYIQNRLGEIKIGYTSNIAERMRAHRSYGPIEILALEAGGSTVEAMRHRQFNHLMCDWGWETEWFNPGSDLINHIGSLSSDETTTKTVSSITSGLIEYSDYWTLFRNGKQYYAKTLTDEEVYGFKEEQYADGRRLWMWVVGPDKPTAHHPVDTWDAYPMDEDGFNVARRLGWLNPINYAISTGDIDVLGVTITQHEKKDKEGNIIQEEISVSNKTSALVYQCLLNDPKQETTRLKALDCLKKSGDLPDFIQRDHISSLITNMCRKEFHYCIRSAEFKIKTPSNGYEMVYIPNTKERPTHEIIDSYEARAAFARFASDAGPDLDNMLRYYSHETKNLSKEAAGSFREKVKSHLIKSMPKYKDACKFVDAEWMLDGVH